MEGIPFRYVAGHILVIPVQVGSRNSEFILDTGCGVNVISAELAKEFNCAPLKMHTGRRMSGQVLKVNMVNLGHLRLGPYEKSNIAAGVWDLKKLLGGDKEFEKIEGFVSLNFLKDIPFTLDYEQKKLFIENDDSLKKRLELGLTTPVKVITAGDVDTCIKVPIAFANKARANCEVDTGSSTLILNQNYMKGFGINKDSSQVTVKTGKDETDHEYSRYFTKLDTDVFLSAAPQIRQSQPSVQFQKIIHQGLIGDAFLHNFIVTYDLPHKRMIFRHY